jgi:hypothetical protein
VVAEQIVESRFRIRRQLETGILFDVFEAEDDATGSLVRLSVVGATWEESGALLPRVTEEATKAKQLIHPHICAVRHVSLDDGHLHVAEAAGGETLEERLNELDRVPAADAVAITVHVCEALAYAHEQGLVHGGLSTDSIRLAGDQVKLDGFGVIGAIGRTPETSGLARRQRAAYISPEEARGNVPGPASDIYSVGVILFRLVTGRLPFESADPMELARAHCYSPAPDMRTIAPEVPAELESVVTRALAKDPTARPASAKNLLGELREQSRRLGAPALTARPIPMRRATAEARPAPRDEALEKQVLRPIELVKALAWTFGRFLAGALLISAGAVAVVSLLFLWLVSTRHPEVVVPDVTGLPSDAALTQLAALGLTMVVAEERYSTDVPRGSIIRMIAPYARKQVREGRQVRVIVSKGIRTVRVPDVHDLTVEEAKRELQKAHLRVAPQIEERQHEIAPKGHVIDQRPEAGTVIPEGTEVALVRSKGPITPRRVKPDTVSWYRVKVTVPAGDMTQRIRIEVEHQDGTVQIAHDQLHLQGQVVDEAIRGVGAFTIRVYVDNKLWREIRPVRE